VVAKRIRLRRFLPLPLVLGPLALLALLANERDAHAEPTTWLSLGGGYAFEHNGVQNFDARATVFTAALGAGTSANHPFVFGGIFRETTYLTLGTDISLSARITTGGFARGDWGVGIDLGVAGRWWQNQDYGHFPVRAALVLGAPFGFQLDVGSEFSDVTGDHPTARGGFALLEFDFLRLTVNRSGNTTSGWPNPSVANGPRAPDAPALPGEATPGK